MIIDSLKPVSDKSIFVIYADDVTLLHHVCESENDSSQLEVENIVKWANENHMTINTEKTFWMTLSTRKNNVELNPLFLSDKIIKQMNELKILGFTFTENLKANAHFDKVLKKSASGMYFVNRLYRFGAPPDVIRDTFFAFVASHIASHAWPVWCDFNKTTQRNSLNRFFIRLKSITRGMTIDVDNFTKSICIRLVLSIAWHNKHPLRCCFFMNPHASDLLDTNQSLEFLSLCLLH